MGVFKAYDVRGRYPDEVNASLAYRIGRAFAAHLQDTRAGDPEPVLDERVAVGHDMRPSSPLLAEAVADGLRDGGLSVLEVGQVTTPALYFVVGSRRLLGGVVVTASHNPAGDNGFKLSRPGVRPVGSTSGLEDVEARCAAHLPPCATRAGTRRERIVSHYVSHVARLAGPVGALRVAFDCGNGVVGPTLDTLLRLWPGVEPVRLFFTPDGTFPNHPADPLNDETLAWLKRAVVEAQCDLGVAFDGDGDRCVFVDEQGRSVSPDLVTALLAGHVLRAGGGGAGGGAFAAGAPDQDLAARGARDRGSPSRAIVYDVPSSRVVREEILAAGGEPVEERVGHSFIKERMSERRAPFGGESSGHYYWADHWFADSALITVGRVLALVSALGRPFSEVVSPLNRTFRSGLRNFAAAEAGDKDRALARLVEAFPGAAVSRLDGVKVELPGWWWFLARKSNTENKLRVMIEASSAELRDDGLTRVEAVLADAGFAPCH